MTSAVNWPKTAVLTNKTVLWLAGTVSILQWSQTQGYRRTSSQQCKCILDDFQAVLAPENTTQATSAISCQKSIRLSTAMIFHHLTQSKVRSGEGLVWWHLSWNPIPAGIWLRYLVLFFFSARSWNLWQEVIWGPLACSPTLTQRVPWLRGADLVGFFFWQRMQVFFTECVGLDEKCQRCSRITHQVLWSSNERCTQTALV